MRRRRRCAPGTPISNDSLNPFAVRACPLTRLVPRLHERLRRALDLLRARAGLKERGADSKAVRAGAPIGRDALGRNAADRIELSILWQNRAPRSDHLRGHRLAR